MYKPMITVTLLGLTALGWMQDRRRPVATLGEGRMVLEWTPGEEAVVKIAAESEDELECVRILRPDGRKLVELDARDQAPSSLASLEIELREPTLERLFHKYAQGDYEIRAETVGGTLAIGKARLSFDLPAPPRIVHPAPGELVRASGLTVFWLADRAVAGYELEIEQDDEEELRVRLPPRQNSFRVPNGLLAPERATSLEVVAVGANGNRTVAEVLFVTRP